MNPAVIQCLINLLLFIS
uniref:Uncharacterized protein n=1 Tax=Arundo donax TaxID=35708 RepID=A0A0A9BJT1_ARUDO